MDSPRRLIAIVDDEQSVRRAIGRLLVSAGFRVKAYSGGVEFLESLDSSHPDCVIIDLHMPGLNGFDVEEKLRDSPHPMPVIIITGHDTPESQRRALASGAAAYLRKPVDDQILLDAVTRSFTAQC